MDVFIRPKFKPYVRFAYLIAALSLLSPAASSALTITDWQSAAVHGRGVGDEASISEFGGRLMLETLRYKVAFDVETARPRMLFDLLRDPEERNDLLDTEVSANVLDMLRWQLGQSLVPLRAGGV